MGSPLLPVVANLYMEAFEKQTLEASLWRPTFLVRYVDDVFSIWPHDTQSLDEFLGHPNPISKPSSSQWRRRRTERLPFLMYL